MSLRPVLTALRPARLFGLVALAAGALLMVQALGTPAAHADQPGPQAIIVGDNLSITTNRTAYHVGDWAYVCYRVPAAGYIEITDHQGGSVKTLKAGFDDGTGDCFWGQVTPPFGQECLRIRYFFPFGGSTSQHTCFQVLHSFPFPFPF